MAEKIALHYHVEGGDLSQAGEASSKMKMSLRRLGLPPDAIRRASICMYEGEINMVIHANGGEVTVEVGLDEIDITLADTGPGIPDIDLAMEEGYSTAGDVARDLGFGAGMGLPNMKRYSDEMNVESTVGVGTTVWMKIRI
ncbi:MAG: ATP-binding protein [Oscillospiraceae bacterium]